VSESRGGSLGQGAFGANELRAATCIVQGSIGMQEPLRRSTMIQINRHAAAMAQVSMWEGSSCTDRAILAARTFAECCGAALAASAGVSASAAAKSARRSPTASTNGQVTIRDGLKQLLMLLR